MSAPPYPERGAIPWDKKLKDYIDHGDTLGAQGPEGPPGPPGPEGPAGPAGAGGGSVYVHDQIATSAVWTAVHNLGRYPSVTVVDSGNTVIFADVHYDSNNQVTIVFGSSTSGKAYLS
jgi:hypothetical protein